MLSFVDYHRPLGLLSAGELHIPYSDGVKYSILCISVALLLLALSILAWQICRFCSQEESTYTPQRNTVHNDLLYAEEKATTSGNYSGAPSTMVEDINSEANRLSRCLSLASFPSSDAGLADVETREQDNIKQIYGSVRFSVYYDQLQSRLVVTVLQVEGLLEHSQARSLQPFVRVRLMWAGSQGVEVEGLQDEEGERTPPVLWTVLHEWRTRIVKGSCNPLFGDQFSCILKHDREKLHDLNLRMEVRDFDKFSRDTVLGEVRVHLDQLKTSYPVELQEDLQIPQKDLVGEVLLSLKFLPTSQRLEVGLLKIRTILTESSSDAVLYARISVQCNQCKLRYQKTSAMPRGLVTVFNEVLMFTLPDLPLDQCKISVSVYETKKSAKQLIGQFSVERDNTWEDEHWTLMMRSIRQPVAKWHGLLI